MCNATQSIFDATNIALAALVVSVLAFFLSFAQLIIQRVHNKKTVKPLGQLDFGDFPEKIYVHLVNNGIGPMIVTSLKFTKGKHTCDDIVQCLDLDPKIYDHVSINKDVSKSVSPTGHLVVAELVYSGETNDFKIDLRKQLSKISIEAVYKDIYGKKFTVSRQLGWFIRHLKKDDK